MNRSNLKLSIDQLIKLSRAVGGSMPAALVATTVAERELRGLSPHAIGDLVADLKSPFSSVSRVAYELQVRKLVRYEHDRHDRRKRIVRAEPKLMALVRGAP